MRKKKAPAAHWPVVILNTLPKPFTNENDIYSESVYEMRIWKWNLLKQKERLLFQSQETASKLKRVLTSEKIKF